MRPPLDDAIVLVTGASSGIGRELARQLAPRAKTLILVARRKERLTELAAELEKAHKLTVAVMACDLTDRAALETLCDEILADYGRIDILVNNAGSGDIGLFERADWDKIERMLELNMRALGYLTHRLIPAMVERRRGGILMISSGFGLAFMPIFSAYAATKHYVTALSEGLRLELLPAGVVVTQVCPGPVATEFEEQAGNDTGMAVPGFVQISAEHCAKSAIAGFARGKALVVPGLVMKLMMFLNGWTPRWVFRLLYGVVAKWFRRRTLHPADAPQP